MESWTPILPLAISRCDKNVPCNSLKHTSAEVIKCAFDDNSKIIFFKSS